MNKADFRAEMMALAADLIPSIEDDYCAHDESDAPSMQVTIGADDMGWAYQTGDNSYTGGAYSYATWAVTELYRDTNPVAFADDVISQLVELAPDCAPIFAD